MQIVFRKNKKIFAAFSAANILKKLFDFQYLRDNGSSAEAECLTCLKRYVGFILKCKGLTYSNCLSRLHLSHKLINGFVI